MPLPAPLSEQIETATKRTRNRVFVCPSISLNSKTWRSQPQCAQCSSQRTSPTCSRAHFLTSHNVAVKDETRHAATLIRARCAPCSFNQLAELLDSEKASRMDKVTIISDAVKAVTQLRAEAHQLRQFKKLLEVRALLCTAYTSV